METGLEQAEHFPAGTSDSAEHGTFENCDALDGSEDYTLRPGNPENICEHLCRLAGLAGRIDQRNVPETTGTSGNRGQQKQGHQSMIQSHPEDFGHAWSEWTKHSL